MRNIVKIVHALNEMNRIIKQLEDIDRRIISINWTLDEMGKSQRKV